MKKNLLSASIALIMTLMLVTVATAEEAKKGPFNNFEEEIGYTIGVKIGQNLKANFVDVDYKTLVKGLNDGFYDIKTVMTEAEMDSAEAKASTMLKDKYLKNSLEKATKFLAENKTKEGVKVTPSGLQYEVITEGKGESPKVTDQVKVNYKGALVNGRVFDSSYQRKSPGIFSVGNVIPGWIEALQMMKPGAKWKLVIPPALAYGDRGAGNAIGPNEVLIFEIELLEVLPPAKKAE
ncbi:FKBP-type peptidyl-prolyl cis-trans isomerase [Desulfoluna sp.]|uniref:FKBP-type peptidyl-prolyl cis-trans isomerase n=1 Tax=Desulfoluna sp. TaxID=2045199 RepID=UPI002622812F|nr:FKBP-type peptidyl-prolyl cis-trans isomerase [Desulfoluna sp.]